MHEYSTPQVVELEPSAALPDAVVARAAAAPDTVVFTRKVDGRWAPVTAQEFATEVSSLAAGLVAQGVKAGDRVGLMSKTRYEWTLVDYAIWTAGAVTVPIYETSSAEQVQWNLGDSGAVATSRSRSWQTGARPCRPPRWPPSSTPPARPAAPRAAS